jgi:hypothetical protein
MTDVVAAAEVAKDELPKGQTAEAQAPHAGARWLFQLAMGLALVALADWLFYGHTVGISAALLLTALAAAAVLANPLHASKRDMLIACGVLVASVVPLIVNVSILSVLFGALHGVLRADHNAHRRGLDRPLPRRRRAAARWHLAAVGRHLPRR